MKLMTRAKAALVGAGVLAAISAAACSQTDVKNADQAFHQAAQATHDTGKDLAQGAKKAGTDIKKDTK